MHACTSPLLPTHTGAAECHLESPPNTQHNWTLGIKQSLVSPPSHAEKGEQKKKQNPLYVARGHRNPCMGICVNVHVVFCVCACVNVYVHVYVYLILYMYVLRYLYIYVCVCVCVCEKHVHRYIYIGVCVCDTSAKM